MCTKLPPAVMVFDIVSNERGIHHDFSIFQQGLRVNAAADADAYVETLQTIVVKSPRIDNVANGGRPYVFLQDSAASHKALETQDSMAENFQHQGEWEVVGKEANKHPITPSPPL
ncbi:hypothetical protein ACTXT7_000261 [Hymenolepis weldensis]